jgi:mannose/fructose/N-acetylgalactosamine-specific phosphotransferase system component IID
MTFQQFLTGLIQGLLIVGLTLLILWLLGANTMTVFN